MRSGAVGTTATPGPICRASRRRRSAYRERCVAASIAELWSPGTPRSSAGFIERREALRRADVVPRPRVKLAADAPLPNRLGEQRRQLRLGAALDPGEQLRPVQRDAAEGEPRAAFGRDLRAVQDEIARSVV